MVSKKIYFSITDGLHIEPACILANTAEQCESTVELVDGDDIVNCRSILNILSRVNLNGKEVELRCTGPTEEKDLEYMLDVIENQLKNQNGEEK